MSSDSEFSFGSESESKFDSDSESEYEEEETASEDHEWEVESIVDDRLDGDTHLFLVKWAGYPESANTWEPESNLTSSSQLLETYWTQKAILEDAQAQAQTQAQASASIPAGTGETMMKSEAKTVLLEPKYRPVSLVSVRLDGPRRPLFRVRLGDERRIKEITREEFIRLAPQAYLEFCVSLLASQPEAE
jgi:hypothetical protein